MIALIYEITSALLLMVFLIKIMYIFMFTACELNPPPPPQFAFCI
jgi:hypothetical protein